MSSARSFLQSIFTRHLSFAKEYSHGVQLYEDSTYLSTTKSFAGNGRKEPSAPW